MIQELPNGSAYVGQLPKGCVQCEKGAKLVLLVDGICSCSCFYCPLSEAKQGKSDGYANEKRFTSDDDIITEAESIDAEGTGITGGDPLISCEKTIEMIQLLKEKFGEQHHIHLYTATPDAGKVHMLAKAGLNEIRFHPPPETWTSFSDTNFPECIKIAKDEGMAVGLEIPVIPDKREEILALIDSAEKAGAEFVNLNELEFSDTNWRELKARGYEIKDDVSSGAKGSESLALEILERSDSNITLHYCSSSFKDGVQLRRRILRRAQITATPLEIITDDGTFVKGVVECDNPEQLAGSIAEDFDIPPDLIRYDPVKNRIEMAAWILEEIHNDIDGQSFIIEEYPTSDRLEVERRPL